jgi:hypothetical protein
MSIFSRAYTGFTLGMTAYGFNRGYRCEEYKDALYLEKILAGVVNSTMYTAPGVNLFAFSKLINRIEIEYRNLDKTKHSDNYKELVGQCNHTF